jgi:hypothetical protein
MICPTNRHCYSRLNARTGHGVTSLQYMCRYQMCALRKESEIDSRNVSYCFEEQGALRTEPMRTKCMTAFMGFQLRSLHYKLTYQMGVNFLQEFIVNYSLRVRHPVVFCKYRLTDNTIKRKYGLL